MARIQFILKHRDNKFTDEVDESYSYTRLSSGLMNSARFVQEALGFLGHETELVHVVDNNAIDREVARFKPDVVFIEAYWVVPEKFEVLARLHPKVTWAVRNHSATPFAANEGIIFDWSLRYMDYNNVVLCCNDARAHTEFRDLIKIYKPEWSEEQIDRRVVMLPNYYPPLYNPRPAPAKGPNDPLDIACFGAVRPLKNHMIQAVAALRYAERVGRKLRFHINGTRIEGKGDAILNNLRKLFDLVPHELVMHPWCNHADFIQLVRQMDLGLQVSYTETFNIVAADLVTNGVPVVTSDEIKWVHPDCYADPNSTVSIVEAIDRTMAETANVHENRNFQGLVRYNDESIPHWLHFVETRSAAPIAADSLFSIRDIVMGGGALSDPLVLDSAATVIKPHVHQHVPEADPVVAAPAAVAAPDAPQDPIVVAAEDDGDVEIHDHMHSHGTYVHSHPHAHSHSHGDHHTGIHVRPWTAPKKK